MRLEMYSVYDKKAGCYTPPFFVRTKGEAIRSFSEAISDGKAMFAKYPEDYHLFYLGEFDDGGGRIEPVGGGPEPVIGAQECVIKPEFTRE